MKLAQLIVSNVEELLIEWEAFANSLVPPGTMTSFALRDHAKSMLIAIAQDIETNQSEVAQVYKSKGFAQIVPGVQTAAMTHGALRHLAGFDLRQLAAEFRALRASVLRLWLRQDRHEDDGTFYEMTRFNEAIDQALSESIANYSEEVDRSRDTFLAILGHDLRNPLSAISNSGVYLSRPGVIPEGEPLQAAVIVNRSAARMQVMIEELLEYTRTRLGRPEKWSRKFEQHDRWKLWV